MFEITAEDIAGLNDEDLRSLIALLCEAEMRRLGYPTSSVTWGGDQNAPDGGVDVRVDLPKRTTVQGFVPRVATGFQVKKSDMTPSEISGEMRPHGKVRSVIRDLATRSGAYIIVSSKGSVTDSALRRRREAMSAAVKGIKNRGLLALDFYDRGRVATWLRDHPGLIPWVRQKLGKTVRGWRSYGAWANPAERESAPYLLDDTLRIRTGKKTAGSVSAAEGLNRIRGALREPRKVVRIVGLSGVGKTRLVQALLQLATICEEVANDMDGSKPVFAPCPRPVRFPSDSDQIADITPRRRRAIKRHQVRLFDPARRRAPEAGCGRAAGGEDDPPLKLPLPRCGRPSFLSFGRCGFIPSCRA
jgi:hypothetical protein